jgi:hypothetical protein
VDLEGVRRGFARQAAEEREQGRNGVGVGRASVWMGGNFGGSEGDHSTRWWRERSPIGVRRGSEKDAAKKGTTSESRWEGRMRRWEESVGHSRLQNRPRGALGSREGPTDGKPVPARVCFLWLRLGFA